MNQFIEKSEIRGNGILNKAANYLISTYKQSVDVFTYSTSFGQLLLVAGNFTKLVLYYISDAITELNIKTANRDTSIYGIAQMQGHNAMRGKSATGEISFVKSGLNKELVGDYIIIPNYVKIRCLYNELTYLIDLGEDMTMVSIKNPNVRTFKIMEGKLETQTFTGTGQSIQTYEVTAPPNKLIDDDFVLVSINGNNVKKYVSLYDIPYKQNGVLVKTGITSGVDIQFGSSEIHGIPNLGEQIRIDYLLTNGAYGNIIGVNGVEFKFIDSAFDTNGNSVDINDFLQIKLEKNPDLGVDSENSKMTAILAPNVSKNHIIHDAKSLKYFLERMNYFSSVRVTNDVRDNINQLNTIALPRITDRFSVNDDYFSLDLDLFTISDDESNRILNMLDESGNKSASIAINFVKPTIRKFAAIIMLDVFDRMKGSIPSKDFMFEKIRETLNVYMVANKRVTKIPHSDLVRILDELTFVDTVKVLFVSADGSGIDNMGNINVGDTEVAVLRGDFRDSNGVYYEDSFLIDSQNMGSVNIHLNYVTNYLEMN